MRPDERVVPVTTCRSPAEAELKRHVLVDAGIDAFIGTDDAGGLHPEMGFAYPSAYRVLVPEDRVEEAAALLAGFEDDVAATDQEATEAAAPAAGATEAAAPDGAPADVAPTAADAGADVARSRRPVLWIALLTVGILLAAVIANTVNVFTGL